MTALCVPGSENATVDCSHRHPVTLPGGSHLTGLVVLHNHETVAHFGIGHTFAALKAQYWIRGGNSVVRRVIKNCLSCRKKI